MLFVLVVRVGCACSCLVLVVRVVCVRVGGGAHTRAGRSAHPVSDIGSASRRYLGKARRAGGLLIAIDFFVDVHIMTGLEVRMG